MGGIAILAIATIVAILMITGMTTGINVSIIAIVAVAIIAIILIAVAVPVGMFFGAWKIGLFFFAINPILGIVALVVLCLLFDVSAVNLLNFLKSQS